MYWVRYRGETTRVRSESCISVDDLRYEVQRALWRAMGRFDISDLTVSYPAGTALQNDTRLAELARRAGADSHDALVVTVNAAAEAGEPRAATAIAPSSAPPRHIHRCVSSRSARGAAQLCGPGVVMALTRCSCAMPVIGGRSLDPTDTQVPPVPVAQVLPPCMSTGPGGRAA